MPCWTHLLLSDAYKGTLVVCAFRVETPQITIISKEINHRGLFRLFVPLLLLFIIITKESHEVNKCIILLITNFFHCHSPASTKA